MRRRKTCPVDFVPVLTCVLLAASCAGIINGREQRVPVTSAPAGATVIVNGVRKGMTPLDLYLRRGRKTPVIRIESPGYDPVVVRVGKRASGLPLLGNIVFGLGPALFPAGRYYVAHDGEGALGVWLMWAAAFGAAFTILDTATGSINEFAPKEIVVTLKKANGPPKVETILLDEQAFRNIKWIRVHVD